MQREVLQSSVIQSPPHLLQAGTLSKTQPLQGLPCVAQAFPLQRVLCIRLLWPVCKGDGVGQIFMFDQVSPGLRV